MNYLKTRGMYLSVEWLQIDCKLLQKKIYVSVREWQCERTESIFFFSAYQIRMIYWHKTVHCTHQ